MTAILAKPYVFKDGTIKIDADNFESAVNSFQLTPTVSTLTFQAITPAGAFTDTTSPTWVAAIGYAQDWDTPGSLSNYLLANAGQTKTLVFTPVAGTGNTTFTVDVIIVPGPIGGPGNTVQVGTVNLGVVGEPTPGVAA